MFYSTYSKMPSSVFLPKFNECKAANNNLQHFMSKFAISCHDANASVNTLMVRGGKILPYAVGEDYVDQMMALVEICSTNDVEYEGYELQDATCEHVSGIVFEFECPQDVNFDDAAQQFTEILFRDVLAQYVTFSKETEQHYGFHLKLKPRGEDLKLQTVLHRIIVPSVMLDADARYVIFDRVWNSLALKKMFEETLHVEVRSIFKRERRLMPIELYRSTIYCGDIPCTFEAENAYQISVSAGRTNGHANAISANNFAGKFPMLWQDISVTHAASDGCVITKGIYSLNESGQKRLERTNAGDEHLFRMAYEKALARLRVLTLTSPNAAVLADMMGMMHSSRFETREAWLLVIYALATQGSRYKYLAIVSTFERALTITSWADFQEQWKTAIASDQKHLHSIRSIRYWVIADSPSAARRYLEGLITSMIEADVNSIVACGSIGNSHVGNYLYTMFGDSYIAYSASKKVGWYEFVTPQSKDPQDHLYKWRDVEEQTDEFGDFIASDLTYIASAVKAKMHAANELCDKLEKHDPRKIHMRTLFSAYSGSIKQMINTKFSIDCIKAAAGKFKLNSFVKQMDTNPYICGVKNGVVEFRGAEATLIDTWHSHAISKTMPTNYVPYDPESPYVKSVYGMLETLFPENERDAMTFLLCYISTSLDWLEKESLLFIIDGVGSNGKSVLLDLINRTLGSDYVRKMDMSFLTTPKRAASGAASPLTMELRGARLVYYSESEKAEKLNTCVMREITGNEMLSARQLYGRQENFLTNCNHIVATNDKFIIESTMHGVWRRIKAYTFKMRFCDEVDPKQPFDRQRDQPLIDAIKNDKRYHEAFLSILVHYRAILYSKYKGRLLNIPHATIKRETELYRQSEDIYQKFIMQNIYYKEGREQPIEDLLANFRRFYNTENTTKYAAKNAFMIGTFCNSSIQKHVIKENGIYNLRNIYSRGEAEPIEAGSILYSEWLDRNGA